MMKQISCHGLANTRPLFLIVYAFVIMGILVSSVYILSSLYSTSSQVYPSSKPYAIDPAPVGGDDWFTPQSQSIRTKAIWDAPSPSTAMPPLKEFRLTKQMVQKRAKDNIVIVTFGNYAFLGFILTWVKHLTDLGLSNLLVGAMDTRLLEALYWKGIPTFDMGSNMSTIDVGWGSPLFHSMGRERAILVDAILSFGHELLMSDTDIVWLKNPLPYFARYPEADVLSSSDQLQLTVVDDRLDDWQEGTYYNIGIIHWRPTNSAKKMARQWKDMLLAYPNLWDQEGFNILLHRKLGRRVDNDSGLIYAYDGNLKVGLLPGSIFCSGHAYFVQSMHEQLKLEPYAVHTTFQFSGTLGKIHRFRETKLFFDPPDYYDAPGGLLTYKLFIPKSLLVDGEHNIESHFSLVNYQIKQIRTALAIASLLNRTLVMPPLWCRLDRLWWPHPGVLKGTLTQQPFICPLDHVFKVNFMLKELPEEEYGPDIKFREYSFFNNPSLPQKLKESWLNVQLCQQGENCNASTNFNSAGVLRFPKNSSEEAFLKVFSSLKNVKVIQFLSIQDAFSGFSDKIREKRFRNRVKQFTDQWCCLWNTNSTGQLYYDMYWDEKPDWKPIQPRIIDDFDKHFGFA